MRVDLDRRISEPVSVVHRASETRDSWKSTVYPRCNWQERRDRLVASDGTAQSVDSLLVQIPEDMGDVPVSMGDYLVRGRFDFVGTTAELVAALPDGAKRVSRIRDLRGALSGIDGASTRYASTLILESD